MLGLLSFLFSEMASHAPETVTLWTLEAESAAAEYFGKVAVGGALTLEAFRVTLEANDVLDWPFQFRDHEDKRLVRKKLERLNGFQKDVHVIWVADEDIHASERPQLGDGSGDVADVAPTAVVEVLEAEVPMLDEDQEIQPVGSFRASGSVDSAEVQDNPLKSVLLPNEVMDRYLERAKKLRAELKRVALNDHEWWLKSFDLNGRGVVKLWCAECKKDCGGDSNDHTKTQIDNLFNNFR